MIMKPVGGAVHLRRGTVNKGLVKWLVLGSVPGAFLGVVILTAVGDSERTQTVVKTSLGVALLLAAGSMIAKAIIDLRKQQRLRAAAAAGEPVDVRVEDIVVRPVATLLVGIVGGLVVGMTSVGSGSLMIVALLLLYPTIRAGQLVGTDLVQAVPLVASASLGHLIFGDFRLGLTSSLLIGALPGVYVGARVSSSAPGGIVRRALVVVLLASSLKLLGAGTTTLVVVLAAVAVVGTAAWVSVYRVSKAGGRDTPPGQLLRAAVTGRRHRGTRDRVGAHDPGQNGP
jgi:uncharacterized membrane protein YfcA